MTAAIEGWVDPRFTAVQASFAENFEQREEVGAAYAVTLGGQPVVDLWGGLADAEAGLEWQADTLQVIFSGTKGLVGLCLLMLVDRGELDLEAPVAEYWPEFAAAGKDGVTVIDLASHQARLPGFEADVALDDLLDDRRMAELLALQAASADPRAAATYHAFTYGWLCGELVRRVDGRSVGRFFDEEVAARLGLELWIGLPDSEEERVSTLSCHPSWGEASEWTSETFAEDRFLDRVWNNPALFDPETLPWNRPEFHRAEIAGAGGIGTARSIARLYGCLSVGGALDGVRLLSPATLALGRRVVTRRVEPLLDEPHAFGVGFQLQTERQVFGPPDDAFGHPGAGRSVHCAWPSHGVGISYVMNSMRDDQSVDPRASALLRATFESLT